MSLNLERNSTRRFQPGQKGRSFAIGIPAFQLQQAEEKSTLMRWTVGAAIALHLVLFFITFPSFRRTIEVNAPPAQKAFVIQQVRFKPPAPQKAPSRPKRKVRKVPIPDPTPDLPEPLLRESFEVPEIQIAEDLGDVNYVPEAPPAPGLAGVVAINGDVIPPQKVFAPQPGYTEEARQARIQGVVILQAIIDIVGNVKNVRILKGLPSGLAESAVDTVLSWKFEPAMLNGDPVPVYYNFTVNFTLQ